MENYQELLQRRNQLEAELERISVKKHGSTPWTPGVQDQYRSDSYSYTEFTDKSKGMQLQRELAKVQEAINTYAQRARREREQEELAKQRASEKYSYSVGGEARKTSNPAMAARYDAQHRFFALNKVQKTIATITGQKKKWEELWKKTADARSPEQQEEIAKQLDGMFR